MSEANAPVVTAQSDRREQSPLPPRPASGSGSKIGEVVMSAASKEVRMGKELNLVKTF